MKVTLPRYRWWLLIACLALLVAGLLCWPRTSGRFTREQYDRIRFGMTPAEVSRLMGSPTKQPLKLNPRNGWVGVAMESNDNSFVYEKMDFWEDESVDICVWYHDGMATVKVMSIRKSKALEWLDWLRGLVRR